MKLGEEPIFSKKETGRFPNPGEVVGRLREKLPASA